MNNYARCVRLCKCIVVYCARCKMFSDAIGNETLLVNGAVLCFNGGTFSSRLSASSVILLQIPWLIQRISETCWLQSYDIWFLYDRRFCFTFKWILCPVWQATFDDNTYFILLCCKHTSKYMSYKYMHYLCYWPFLCNVHVYICIVIYSSIVKME